MSKAKKKTHWLRNTLCVLIACGIVGVVVASVQFHANPDKTIASATVQYAFTGAAEGLAPNGYIFDASAVSSAEVIDAALEASGMTGRYTADQIQPSLSVRGSYPEDILTQLTGRVSVLAGGNNAQMLTVSEYHPTTYTIALDTEFDRSISEADLKNLLENILSSYKVLFAKTGAMGIQDLEVGTDLSAYDYPQMLSVISNRIARTSEYAADMSEKEPTMSLNGQTFSDIGVKLNNLVNTDIARMNGLISTYALTRDSGRLQVQYEYEIKRLNNELSRKKEELRKLEELIQSYRKSVAYVSTSDALLKVDSSSTQTYDSLMDTRKKVSEEIAETSTEIMTYQLRLNDLKKTVTQMEEETVEETADVQAKAEEPSAEQAQAGTGTETSEPETNVTDTGLEDSESTEKISERMETLDRGIQQLLTREANITGELNALIRKYNEQEINDLTVIVSGVKYTAPAYLSTAFAVKVVKTAAPFCAVGLMACLVMIIISRIREDEKE